MRKRHLLYGAALFTASVALASSVFMPMTQVLAYGADESTSFYALNSTNNYNQQSAVDVTSMRGLTAAQIVSDMKAGWNLGNSLESEYNETQWNNPVTTKAMIDAIAAEGFTTLRVPVRWDDHYTDSNYTIQKEYMDRVEEVVNYGLSNNMYVIINCHHNDLQTEFDGQAWKQERIKTELSTIWTQIANRFKNYGDKLIFEVNNEPRNGDDWGGNQTYYEEVNATNEAARAAIRATGGNNASRLIMLPTYCASGDQPKIAAWSKNANDNMIAASIHAYLPFSLAYNGSHTEWSADDAAELEGLFNRLYSYFISNGIPVVMGEFGCTNMDNIGTRNYHASFYTGLARQFASMEIPCIWWDNGKFGTGQEMYGIFDRNSCTFTFKSIADNLVAAYKGDPAYEKEALSENVIFSGSNSSSNYGQAVKLSADPVKFMTDGQYIGATFSSSGSLELILQDGTYSRWVQINPDYIQGNTAYWSYNSLKNAYGDFTDAAFLFIGDKGAPLTVTKVFVTGTSAAHVHTYNGAESITIEATPTTKGRKVVHCSYADCEAIKITLFDYEKKDIKNGIFQENGQIVYYNNDSIDSTFTGFVDYENAKYYLKAGKQATDITGPVLNTQTDTYWYVKAGKATSINGIEKNNADNKWYYYENGIFKPDYTGIVLYSGSYYYVENGYVNFNANGLIRTNEAKNEWHYFTSGKLNSNYTGLVYFEKAANWYYVANGKIDWNYTGIVLYEQNGRSYYVKAGKVDKTYTGLIYDKQKSTWYYITEGKLNTAYEGLVYYAASGKWYYVKNGILDKTFTGPVFYEPSKSYYYAEKGVLSTTFTGLAKSAADNNWYYFVNGKNSKVADVVYYEKGLNWYYVKDGKIDNTYTGLAKQISTGTWYYIANGKVSPITDLVYYSPTQLWYYVKDGKIDFSYTGLAKYSKSDYLYYIANGIMDSTFTGVVKYSNEKSYYVVKGKVNPTRNI